MILNDVRLMRVLFRLMRVLFWMIQVLFWMMFDTGIIWKNRKNRK